MINSNTVKPLSTLNMTFMGLLGVLGGVWLIISPFLLGYSDKVPNASLLGITCGVITILLAAFCVATEKNASLSSYRLLAGAAMVLVGLVLMVGPYLFNYSQLRDPLYNLQITGAIFVIVAGFIMQEFHSRNKGDNSGS